MEDGHDGLKPKDRGSFQPELSVCHRSELQSQQTTVPSPRWSLRATDGLNPLSTYGPACRGPSINYFNSKFDAEKVNTSRLSRIVEGSRLPPTDEPRFESSLAQISSRSGPSVKYLARKRRSRSRPHCFSPGYLISFPSHAALLRTIRRGRTLITPEKSVLSGYSRLHLVSASQASPWKWIL